MAGVRFVLAGAILSGWARLRGAASPSRRHWPAALVIGVLLLLLGNGGVVWAEQTLSSGMTALLIATEPLFLVLLDWLRPGGRHPDCDGGVDSRLLRNTLVVFAVVRDRDSRF